MTRKNTWPEIKEGFIRRDKEAMTHMDIYPSESSRLSFAEGRLTDVSAIVLMLIDEVIELREALKAKGKADAP